MARVVHFEITADDVERACRFYSVFGWELVSADMPGVDYWLAHTGSGEAGINGAIMPRAYNAQPIINWISVENLDAMIQKVREAGGEIAGERHTVPGIGETVYVKDTEGNTLGMIQPITTSTI